jgi:mRNA interferase MazF
MAHGGLVCSPQRGAPAERARRVGRSRLVPLSGSRVVTDLPARGEVWWCELPAVGRRPVVVLSRDAAIPRLRRTLIAPCTTTVRGLASEILLEPAEDPVPLRSAVNLDSVESVPVGTLVGRLGRLGAERMRQVCAALGVAVGCSG